MKKDPHFRLKGRKNIRLHVGTLQVCKKPFYVVHMGISALKGHAQGQGYIRVAGQINSDRIIIQFMKGSAVAAHQTK